ncbi:ImmA/IrrE family metallo-endopeptidase [Phytoactinopolyspora endophytica]|uniref:ImmA/IrrE family metallo-endopeptidase n=1 Tax=Phytoactinopolyspora endophytica TaxID=1642495 RepID=UPI00101DBA75|nr:ImmA/IrrE family metallo-endopeptidase [Phytoactinopolyspora endophytica]
MTSLPNYAVPAGEFVAEWMEDHAVNAAELARRLGVSRKHVSELLRGKASLSHETALGLERVTGIPARIWNQYESLYREDLARLGAEQALVDQHEEAKAFPLRYLRTYSYITADTKDRVGTVSQLLKLLGVASLQAWNTTWKSDAVAYRKSLRGRDDCIDLAVWLTLGERAVRWNELNAYNETQLRDILPSLRALTRDDPSTCVDNLVAKLASVGVALTFVPEVPGLGVYGATRWLGQHPIVQLSLRGKADDQVWFTLFHEIGHVLLHAHNGLYLNTDRDHAEDEANQFAADTLIPPEHAERMPRGRNIQAVRAFAEEIGVAPGIVLGRIHRETGDYAWGHQLKRRFEFQAEPQRE